jgi:TonB family protein
LVVIVEGPSLPKRLYPLVPDAQSGDLSTTVEIETPPLGAMGAPPKAIPVSVMIARIRGMELAHIGKRTVYVTLGAPMPGSASLAGPPSETAPMQPRGRPTGLRGEPAAQTALAQESVREENLLHPSPLNGSHAYWKRVNDLIGLSLRERLSAQPPSRARRNPAVRFRLFANGEAQLIQLERSSEDPRIDESAMLAVLDAHPFPPFPEDAADPYLDVHVVLPVLTP